MRTAWPRATSSCTTPPGDENPGGTPNPFVIGGLVDGRSYLVLPGSTPSQLRLGVGFSGAVVDPDGALLDLGRPHNLQSGDMVRYRVVAGAPIPGLVNGQLYRVVRVDANRVKLAIGAPPAPVGFLPSAMVDTNGDGTPDTRVANGAANEIWLPAHGFVNDQAVTYHAPRPVEFGANLVDVSIDGSGNPVLGTDGVAHSDTDLIFARGHGFSNGEIVRYTSTGASIGGLVSGTDYRVAGAVANGLRLVDAITGDPTELLPGTTGTHLLFRPTDLAVDGLVDGRTYYVQVVDANRVRLLTRPSAAGGVVVDFTDSFRTGVHTLGIEGVPLFTPGDPSSTHELVLDLTSGLPGGDHRMLGIGGAGTFGGTAGDGVVEASASGTGGGVINLQGASSVATSAPTVRVVIGEATQVRAGDVVLEADSTANARSVTTGRSGGVIDFRGANATTNVENTVRVEVGSSTGLTAQRPLLIATRDVRTNALALEIGVAKASTKGGGLVSGGDAHANLNATHHVVVDIAGSIDAGRTVLLNSSAGTDVSIDSVSGAGGLFSSAAANDDNREGDPPDQGIRIGTETDPALVQVAMSRNGVVRAPLVALVAEVGRLHEITGSGAVAERPGTAISGLAAFAAARSNATALGADSDANASIDAETLSQVLLRGASKVDGDRVVILSRHVGIRLRSEADADCSCGGGDTDATARVDYDSDSLVTGELGAVIKTGDLFVRTDQQVTDISRDADKDGGLFDDGDETTRGGDERSQDIDWRATVYLLGEPDPVLVIDEAGRVVRKTRNVTVFAYDAATGVVSAPLVIGDLIAPSSYIVVGDLVLDESGRAQFSASDDGAGTRSSMFGTGGVFYVQHTWDTVRIVNRSDRGIVLGDIDDVFAEATAFIAITTDDIPVTFDLRHAFGPTDLQVRNLDGRFTTIAPSPVIIDGDIENPVGRTWIRNVRGDIVVDHGSGFGGCFLFVCLRSVESVRAPSGAPIVVLQLADTDEEIIRTNVLILDAAVGTIGTLGVVGATGRNPIPVELVEYRLVDGTLMPITAWARAGADLVLDLWGNDRAGGTGPLAISIDSLTAGDDVDVVLRESVRGADLTTMSTIHIDLFAVPPAAPIAGSGPYVAFFRPDAPGLLVRDHPVIRAIGTKERTPIGAVWTFGREGSPGLASNDNISVGYFGLQMVDIVAYTDAAAGLIDPRTFAPYVPGPELDDDIATTVPQVSVRSMRDVTVIEVSGDLPLGLIHSDIGDVTVMSDARVLDANGLIDADIEGSDVLVVAGMGGKRGGVGEETDFVEIDTETSNPIRARLKLTGVGGLTVVDTLADTRGVYLDELIGTLRINRVATTTHVSLRTTGGSIVDGCTRDDEEEQKGKCPMDDGEKDRFEPDVIGESIDLDANRSRRLESGGDIGEEGDALEIAALASRGCNGDDVALEADGSIDVEQLGGRLCLLVARTLHGDIRLWVPVDANGAPDLEIMRSGEAWFAESNSRAPWFDPDAPRFEPVGGFYPGSGFWIVIPV